MKVRKMFVEPHGKITLETEDQWKWFQGFRFGVEPQSVKPCLWSLSLDKVTGETVAVCYRIGIKFNIVKPVDKQEK